MRTKVYHITFHSAFSSACLFFDGCNFSCKGCLRRIYPYDCHLGQNYPKEVKIRFLSVEEIINLLSKVTPEEIIFEGWEPTMDKNLKEIAKAIKKEIGSYTLLLTNGYLFPPFDAFDEIKISIKAYNEKIHEEYTGMSNKNVLANFKKTYEETSAKISAETVLIPEYVDAMEIKKIADFIASVDENIPLRIDSYWSIASREWQAPTKEEMYAAVKEAKKYLKNVYFLAGDESIKGEVIKVI